MAVTGCRYHFSYAGGWAVSAAGEKGRINEMWSPALMQTYCRSLNNELNALALHTALVTVQPHFVSRH